MAHERNPNDPFRDRPIDPYVASDPYLASRTGDNTRDPARLDDELPDPELAEDSVGGTRIAMFAVAIALVLGAVFYGLNNSSINQAGTSGTSSTAQNTPQGSSPPAAPPGMRDVTPRANTEPGTTTGAAPASPPTAAPAAPTGQDMNRAGNPPASNTAPNEAPNK